MIDERLRELVQLRMQQAAETLHEAQILIAGHAARGAVNRAYYAMFYAVLAVLATKGLGSSKHSGVISLFDRELVKPGILPKELSRSLHMAFERRQQADYGEWTQLDEPAGDTGDRRGRDLRRGRPDLLERRWLPSGALKTRPRAVSNESVRRWDGGTVKRSDCRTVRRLASSE